MPATPCIANGPPGSYDNGGAWLYDVFRISGDNLVGFYHAEDREWPGQFNPNNAVWKSIELAMRGAAHRSQNGL